MIAVRPNYKKLICGRRREMNKPDLLKAQRPILWLTIVTIFATLPTLAADDPSPEQQRMIDEGMIEALEASLPKQHSVNQLEWLARAARAKAARVTKPEDRQAAWEAAQDRYRKWIAAFDGATGLTPIQRATNQSLAHAELADMIASGWAAPLLDEFEITGGRRGNAAALIRLLQAAIAEQRTAQSGVADLLDRYDRSEDEFLAAGVQYGLSRLRLDARYQSAWTNLYLAQTLTDARKRDERNAALKYADDTFEWLIDRSAQSLTQQRCRLGRAVVAREAGRAAESEKQLRDLLTTASDSTLRAQGRYELIRALVAEEKFAEARESVSQLLDTDTTKLLPEERGVIFYVDLARLWDGNVDLVEASVLRERAGHSNARETLLQQAAAKREQGIAKLDKLRERGGDWPAVVQSYVLSGIDINAAPRSLASGELLYVARALRDARRFREALAALDEFTRRGGVDAATLGDAQFEIGVCKYEAGDVRGAAADFARFARERAAHPLAPQAATNAFRLSARLASESKSAADYEALANILLHLIQTFPQHPDRADAQWWLPVALQKAGKYSDAAMQFANVTRDNPHFEEAQYQRLLSERMLLDEQRPRLTGAEFVSRARKLAEHFDHYSREALSRLSTGGDANKAARDWSAEACIVAAELLMTEGVGDDRSAAGIIARFEKDYPNSPLLARMLGIRIRADIGLGKFDEAIAAATKFLETAPPERVGPLLSIITTGILRELTRLSDESQSDTAQSLATDAIAVFEQLSAWCKNNHADADSIKAVNYGLAHVYCYAGRAKESIALARSLVAADERNGDYQRLLALALESDLSPQSPPKEIEAARDAWGKLLADESIKKRAPDRYWEARLHFLRILLRLGRNAEVTKAIQQERVWSPDLGGERWRQQIESLLADAAGGSKSSPTKP